MTSRVSSENDKKLRTWTANIVDMLLWQITGDIHNLYITLDEMLYEQMQTFKWKSTDNYLLLNKRY